MQDKPPVTCIYCGETISPAQPATIITQTSLDENGEPDFETHRIDGLAHRDCWERKRPDQAD